MASIVTREQITGVIDALPTQYRVMIRLLLVQYLDLTQDDIDYMAGDRPDPRFQQGHKVVRHTLSMDALRSVADRTEQYRAQVRQLRERVWLQIQCLTAQISLSEALCTTAEELLVKRFGFTPEAIQELKRGARTAVPRPALRALERKWDKDEIDEEEYRKERLPVEYQTEIRRLERFRARLNLAKRELNIMGNVPLQDHEIAHIWGIPLSSLQGRKVKALHQYLQSLHATVQSENPASSEVSGPPLDLWKQTFETLSKSPVEHSVAVYDGLEGTEAALLDKLSAFAAGKLQDEVESRLWQAISRDYSPNAVETQGKHQSLFALQRLSAILSEMDLSPDGLEDEFVAKVSPKPKVIPGAEEPAPAPQLGQMAEHVLRSLRGEER